MKKRTLIVLACVLLLSLGTANAQPGQCNVPSFNSPPSFDTGPSPSAVTVGDLNADGFQDLVIPNLTAATVSILLGDGLGAFLPPVSYEVGIPNNAGIYARDAAIADLNSDGKPDLVVVGGYNQGWVSVLLGNGDGSFGAAVSQLTGNATLASVVVGDFNGDTKKDVAVAATDSNKIHFLLGNAGGGFSSTLQVTVAANADEIAVGDLNGDGLSDVVTIHTYPTWGLTSVLGNSSGAFVVNQSIATRSQPQSIVLADLNEDSKLDLAMSFGWADHGIEFRLGDGAGNFGPSTEILTVFEALSPITADVNNDDNLDLIVQLSSASAIEVFLGNGNAGFTRSRSYGTLPDASLALASADFNEDGNADVVSLNAGASAVALLVGDGLGGFATPNVMVAQNQRGPRIVTGDFNGDNRPDVAIPREFANQVMVYLTDAAGRLQAPMFYSTNRPARSVATGDFNHDGKLDLALGTDVGAISILLGNGLGGFTGPTVFNVAVVNIPIVVTLVGKFDGDNHDDLIALQDTSFSGTGTFLLRGDGVGNFGAPSPVNLGEPTTWVAAADFNGDGKLDLALANGFPPQVKILHGDGTGTFTPSGSQYPIPKRAFHLLASDLTKDGRPDLVMTNNDSSPGNVAVMISTGAGFGPAVTIDSTLAPLFITTADFNSDSNPDLAISTHSYLGNIALMSGDGLGNFASPKYFTAGGTAGQIATADFNSDAKPDLVSSNYAAILLNTFTSLPCLSINDVSVTEGDNGTVVAEFTVGLSASSAEPVRVNYVVKPVTAISGVDFSSLSGRLSFAPGETSKTISVPVTADLLDEFDETFKVQLSNPAHAGIADGEGEGTILDNDAAPTLIINDVSAAEGGPFFTRNFTVTVSAPSGKAITVQYATANGTATAGTQVDLNDYFNTTGTLTIPAGQITGTIGVNVFGDDLFEPDETYFINLSNPTNATIEDTQGQGTILNDDPIPTLTFNGAFVEEGNSGEKTVVSQVFLSNPSYLPISFDFATADQTAEAGKDYVATSGTLTISPGARSGSLSVPIIGDTLDEVHETFLLNISNVQNATLTAPPVSLLIIDDDGPTISISDVSVKEGNSGLTNANFTLTLSAASPQQITVRVTTAPGTATSVNDYSFFNLNVSIPAGSVTRTVAIGIIGDTVIEPDETFFVNLTQPVSGTIADAQGIGTILNDDANIQLSAASYTANESGGSVQVAFNRAGDTSTAASVSYATSDTAALTECNVINGVASSRCDYATSIGTVNFAAGEASKNIFIPLVNDGYAEGNETFSITLSNAVGATLGSFSTANVTIQDNETVNGANPLDQVDFFIEQHYIDFLGRNPEPAGLAGWRNVLNNCGVTVAPPCDRIEVSAGFFRSPEFQARGYFIYRFYSSVGAIPLYEQFMPDFAKVSGFLSDAQLEANKVAFVNEFMARPVFQNKYSSTFSNPTAYVDALLQTVGLPSHPSRQTWINQLTASNTSDTRGQVLRALVESQQVYDKYYNEAFVIMQYFGYLRRTADASYLDWINTMNQTGGDYRIMINGFMNSAEYRRRFGP